MSILLDNLKKNKTNKTPIWLMRQAGRHLPEYLEIKKKHKNLLSMFLDTETIVEVTLQPVKRYDLDASIIFSDILIVPYLMGSQISFGESNGPLVDFKKLSKTDIKKAEPIYNAIKKIKDISNQPLIGFSGGVWSTIYYCLFDSETRKDFDKKLIIQKEKEINGLIPIFTDIIITHATNQIKSGIDAFQLFESWSGLLNDEQFEAWCLEPANKIFSALKELGSYNIGFPREASLKNYIQYSNIKSLDCISLDTQFNIDNLDLLNQALCFQGNLNPETLLVGKERLDNEVDDILLAFNNKPHIFNLGHGVLPETPTENVRQLINKIRNNS